MLTRRTSGTQTTLGRRKAGRSAASVLAAETLESRALLSASAWDSTLCDWSGIDTALVADVEFQQQTALEFVFSWSNLESAIQENAPLADVFEDLQRFAIHSESSQAQEPARSVIPAAHFLTAETHAFESDSLDDFFLSEELDELVDQFNQPVLNLDTETSVVQQPLTADESLFVEFATRGMVDDQPAPASEGSGLWNTCAMVLGPLWSWSLLRSTKRNESEPRAWWDVSSWFGGWGRLIPARAKSHSL